MNSVHAARGCPAGAGGVDCAIAKGATISTYVTAGMGGGATASSQHLAFPGLNPNFNAITILTTTGFSTYNALHVNLRGRLPEGFCAAAVDHRVVRGVYNGALRLRLSDSA